MTQPSNQSDKEPEGLTREFNFPKPWIKDYNPQIHGIKPGMDYQQGGVPTTGQSSQMGQPIVGQPGAGPSQGQVQGSSPYPVSNQQPVTQSYHQSNTTANGAGQWNPTGVYGGDAPKEKGTPAWVWTLISAAILIVIILVLFFVVLK